MLTDLNPLDIRRILGREDYGPPKEYGDDSWTYTHRCGDGSVIVSIMPGWMIDDPHDWIHASMTRDGRTPSYEDLCLLRRAAFGDGHAYQVFVPADEHINIHAHACHLWGRVDGQPALPNFGRYGTI